MTDAKTALVDIGPREGRLILACTVGSPTPSATIIVSPGDLGVDRGAEGGDVDLQQRFDKDPLETMPWGITDEHVTLLDIDIKIEQRDGQNRLSLPSNARFLPFVTRLADAKRFLLELRTRGGKRHLVDIGLSNADRADLREAMRQCGTPLR
jgi:hypothetical protein